MEYKIKFRRFLKWKTLTVTGHKLYSDLNRMDLFLKDGSVLSLGNWDKYDMFLGQDWVLAIKKNMENESGQDIKLRVATK